MEGFNSFEDLFAKANYEDTERMVKNPEYTTNEYIHISVLITAFAVGILDSYPYYTNFQMPPNFEKVMNYMSLELQKEFDYAEVPKVCLLKMRGVYKRLSLKCKDYVDWNKIGEDKENNYRDCIEEDIPSSPQFISLDCPPRNAINYLRRYIKEQKEFEKKLKRDFEDRKQTP
jgi:hypothetical protein